MILSIGEALIDKKNDKEYVGGGPLNVAVAISRLNSASCFMGGISSDDYGNKILNFMIDNFIIFNTDFCSLKEPTTIAGVTVKNGKEEYFFNWKGTSGSYMNYERLENGFNENTDINAVFFGSLSYTIKENSKIILDFIENHRVTSFFDPNIRPTAVDNTAEYNKQLIKACEKSDIVKLSEDDLSFWGISERELFDICKHHLVITRGSKGATWYSKDFGFDKSITVDGLSVPVIDTIGCGDCFSGAILHWLDVNNFLKSDLKLKETDIYQALFFSVSVSAINATREGCNPPTLEDLA